MSSKATKKKRSILQQVLLLLIMILVALIMFISRDPATGSWADLIASACLAVCLYVLMTERKLSKREALLLNDLETKDRKVDALDRELNEERIMTAHQRYETNDLDQRLSEITSLYRAIHRVNTESNKRDVVRTSLRVALELVGGSQGAIMLLNSNKSRLDVAIQIGVDRSATRKTWQQTGEGVVGWVAEVGKPLRIDAEAADVGSTHQLRDFIGSTKRAYCIPLMLYEKTIGVMILGIAHLGKEAFDDRHMNVAAIFGQHASAAIICSQYPNLFSRDEYSLNNNDLSLEQG